MAFDPLPQSSALALAQAPIRRSLTASPDFAMPPYSANDPSVLVDIGIASLNPRTRWSDLPSGWTYTAGTGSSLSDVTGFIPGGNAFAFTFTSTLAQGATSGTLSANWPNPTGTFSTVFSDGEVRPVAYTNGATTATWTVALAAAVSASATANLLNTQGRVQSTTFDTTHGTQGTLYIRVDRRALCVDQSHSLTSVWFDSTGNTWAANDGSFPPCLFGIQNAAGNALLFYHTNVGSAAVQVKRSSNNFLGFVPAGGSIPINPQVTGTQTPFSNAMAEYVLTWTPSATPVVFTAGLASTATSGTLAANWAYPTGAYIVTFNDGETRPVTLTLGATTATWTTGLTNAVSNTAAAATTTYWVYVDSMLWYTGVFPPNSDTGTAQILNGQLAQVSIGNFIGGPNAFFGAALGPYAIQRFQISTAVALPTVSDCVVGFLGDSYVAGGGLNGGALAMPSTPSQIYGDTQYLINPDSPPAGTLLNVNAAPGAVGSFAQCMQAMSMAQMGAYFKAFGSAKNGHSLYWTGGYGSPMAVPTPQILFTASSLNGTNGSATIASLTVNGVSYPNGWPMESATYTVTLPSGTRIPFNFTLNSTSCTWTGTLTSEQNTASIASTAYTTGYWDAVIRAAPEILIVWDSVNNGFECPNTTGAGVTPVADLQYILNYIATGIGSRLRGILLLEMWSLEKMPTGSTGSLTPAQWATVSATWRAQLRAAFSGWQTSNNVAVTYMRTYESTAGSANGNLYTWGSNPNNIATTGTARQGPGGSTPDIHPSCDGEMLTACMIWPWLKPFLLSRQQWVT